MLAEEHFNGLRAQIEELSDELQKVKNDNKRLRLETESREGTQAALHSNTRAYNDKVTELSSKMKQ